MAITTSNARGGILLHFDPDQTSRVIAYANEHTEHLVRLYTLRDVPHDNCSEITRATLETIAKEHDPAVQFLLVSSRFQTAIDAAEIVVSEHPQILRIGMGFVGEKRRAISAKGYGIFISGPNDPERMTYDLANVLNLYHQNKRRN